MSFFRKYYDCLPAGLRGAFRASVPDLILRWYAHKKTDVYLISYPKCGRTWLRLMMGRAISSHYGLPENEENLFLRWKNRPHPEIPHITVIHDDRPMLKTPGELQSSKTHFRQKKVIFLARDPRDVIVSSYFEMKNRGNLFGDNPYEKQKGTFEGTLPEFIHRERGGFATILRYYNIWAENRKQAEGFLLVRYEDLKADTQKELRRVIDFLGLQTISEQTLAEAVEYASFDNMRRMETEGRFSSGMLNPADKNHEESYKTRKGKVKGYLEYLDETEVAFLNHQMQEKLSPFFGYTI